MIVDWRETCRVCERTIEGGSAAVTESFSGENAYYEPFLEDLRSSPDRLYHPACFARERGIDVLVGAIHRNDERNRLMRREPWDALAQVERLENRGRDAEPPAAN